MNVTLLSHLSIASWNVQGLYNQDLNKLEDPLFLKEIRKHHIVAVQETHCAPDYYIHVDGYCSHQANRPLTGNVAHGGVGFLVKKEIRRGVKFITGATNDIIWLCLKKDFFNLPKDIYIACIYIPPVNSTYSQKLNYKPYEIIEKEVEKYCEVGYTILLGDFNSRTGKSADYIVNDDVTHIPVPALYVPDTGIISRQSQDLKVCTYGSELLELCRKSGLKIVNGRVIGDSSGRFTCHKYNGSSVVDYIVADYVTLSKMLYFKVDDLIGTLSDHCKISCGLTVSCRHSSGGEAKSSTKIPRKFKWHSGAEKQLVEVLVSDAHKNSLDDLMTSDISDIDMTVDRLNQVLCNAASKCLKRVTSRVQNKKRWFNGNCVRLGAEVRSLGKKMCRDPQNPHIRAAFSSVKRKYKQMIKISKLQFKNGLMNQLETSSNADPKLYWKTLEMLKEMRKEPEVANPISTEDWVEHFRELFSPPASTGQREQMVKAELDELERVPVFNELSFRISVEEVTKAVSLLKSGKAPGLDLLSGEIIKATHPVIMPILVKMFNHILSTGSYPSCWAEGSITPLHKKGSPLDPDNYRGITISSCLGKVFGLVLNRRLTDFAKKYSLIDDRQSSHKKGARTTDNVFVLKSLFEKYCKKGKNLYVGFIDFRKAFDSIWHEGLFLKLLQNHIGGPFYNVIKSIYRQTSSKVRTQGLLSPAFPIQKGVRQGDVLSPLLFNLFINNIVNEFHSPESSPPVLEDAILGCLLYADDLAIISTSQEGLQHSLKKLSCFCEKWKLEVNHKKSKIMCFSKTGKKNTSSFYLNDMRLETVQNYCYLGLELSSNCSFKSAEKVMAEKAKKALFKLKSLLYNTNINPKTALKLFDQLIKPIALYGSEIWGPDTIRCKLTNESEPKFIRSFESFACEKLNLSFARFVLGVHKKAQNTAVLGELGRYPLGLDIAANAVLYLEHLIHDEHVNPLVKDALTSNQCQAKSWFKKVNDMRNYIFRGNRLNGRFRKITRNSIKFYLSAEFNTFWTKKIQDEPKMRTYIKFKSKFVLEEYLCLVPFKQRRALTRLRISAHQLAIERGRYTRPPTAVEGRTCEYCPSKIEDEMHVMLECAVNQSARAELFSSIENICPNFSALGGESKFIYMMTAIGDISKHVACFVHQHVKH